MKATITKIRDFNHRLYPAWSRYFDVAIRLAFEAEAILDNVHYAVFQVIGEDFYLAARIEERVVEDLTWLDGATVDRLAQELAAAPYPLKTWKLIHAAAEEAKLSPANMAMLEAIAA